MKPTRQVSRRSFLASVSGAAVTGGALLAVAGQASALQVTDRDSGAGADPAGRGRSAVPAEPGDSDFANPRHIGDVVESDPPPGRLTHITDSDGGPASDFVGYRRGRTGRVADAARCAATRQRIGQLEGVRPRTAENEDGIARLRAYLETWRCN